MGKVAKRLSQKQSSNNRLSQNQSVEGRLYVEFTFDGITHRRTHLFKSEELALMKKLIEEHGDKAAGTVLWQAAIQNASIFGENVLAVAAQLYSLKHYKPSSANILAPNPLARTEAEITESYFEELAATLDDQSGRSKT